MESFSIPEGFGAQPNSSCCYGKTENPPIVRSCEFVAIGLQELPAVAIYIAESAESAHIYI